ncbi:Aldo/keto reductase [Mycena sanguinolenta]|uniref:Aldo/keto reductase n=1 Tax=Mycena sanguinolenta TaxID=230812 RepID=A0A8H6X8M3_9AGAR|nr:Aldo/keto reductase [Mycena sanguinolenta]
MSYPALNDGNPRPGHASMTSLSSELTMTLTSPDATASHGAERCVGYMLPGPDSIAFAVGNIGSASDIQKRLLQVLNAGVRHLIIPVNFASLSQISAALTASSIPRSDLFLTFFFQAPATGDTEKALKEALDQLRFARYADLYLLRETRSKTANASRWVQMEKLKIKGQLVRSIGIFNFTLNQILALLPTATIIPAVNQILLSPYTTKRFEKTIKACKKLQIAVTASLTDTVHLSLSYTYTPHGLDKVLERIAKQHSTTPTRILVAWLQSQGLSPVITWKEKEKFSTSKTETSFQIQRVDPTPVDIALIDIVGEGPEHLHDHGHGKGVAEAVGDAVS